MSCGLKQMCANCSDNQAIRICESGIFEFLLPQITTYIKLLKPITTTNIVPTDLPKDMRIDYICESICGLLFTKNESVVIHLFSCGLEKQLLGLLKEITPYVLNNVISSYEKDTMIFLLMSVRCCSLLNDGLLTIISDILVKHNKRIQEKKESLDYEPQFFLCRIIFGISLDGLMRSKKKEKNIHHEILVKNEVESSITFLFNVINKIELSNDLSESDKDFIKCTMNITSLTICLIHKGEKLPQSCVPFLVVVKSLLTAMKNESLDYPVYSRLAWDGLIEPEKALIEK
jgi:hypothetical protein